MYTNVLTLLENSAKNSDKIIRDESTECTYSQLLQTVQKIGASLCNYVTINNPIGVLMDKGVECLQAFFGIVESGCFYSLFNSDLPLDRLRSMQKVLNAPYIITDEKHLEIAKNIVSEDKILLFKNLACREISKLDLLALQKIRRDSLDTDPLYINFTSGSTGIPKGVVISHRSVLDFTEIFVNTFNITSEDVIGNQAPFDFDVSTKDIFSAFYTGASLIIVPKIYFSQPVKLLDYLEENKITTMIWAVSALCLITTFHGLDYKAPSNINKILFSGEVMPLKHLKQWIKHYPNALFVNLYGPTEITCNCTYYVVDNTKQYTDNLPIGVNFQNERVFLLDENDNLITDNNISGEICVSGTCVGLGYYNEPVITSKHFLQNPINKFYFERIYRTGDIGYYNEDGLLTFNGRKDFQIKYKGHRIELEEIEKAIMSVDNVVRTCCIFDEEKSRLYAFYIGEIDAKDLHKYLSEKLPAFMIPSRFINKNEFPLTKNGKIDRKKLKEEIRR